MMLTSKNMTFKSATTVSALMSDAEIGVLMWPWVLCSAWKIKITIKQMKKYHKGFTLLLVNNVHNDYDVQNWPIEGHTWMKLVSDKEQ